MFTYVFGGAIKSVTGGDYISFLLPGIIIQTMIFASTNTAVGLALDLSLGLIQRFRSLPMSRAAVLAGRTCADTIRGALTILIMVATGYLIGFRIDDWTSGMLGFLLAVAFGHAFTWIGAAIGLFLKNPASAQVAGFVWLVPVTFVSSIFIPPFTMPDWLRVFADNQPVSVAANATRGLMTGSPDMDNIVLSVVWIVGIMLVFVPLTVWEYARAVSQ
ncbi:MAG: ABC transporter permease [Chloroflexi bacterium]|nr:ABC transporter permease [Chloroflexota bacterium]